MIVLNDLNVAYIGKNIVLHDISLHIFTSELVILMGRSGSGKSTLLKVLNGSLPPISGDYYFGSSNIYQLSDLKRRRLCSHKIGFVWQDYRLVPELNVLNNIVLPSLITNLEISSEYLYSLLDLLEIERHINKYPSQLSGGEQQRVAMARALVLKPELVIADEPTGALDIKTSDKIMNLFLKINEKLRTTFVIATHNEDLVRIGTRLIELSDGRVVRDVKLQ